MKNHISKINRLHELHSEAERRYINHDSEAMKYRPRTDAEAKGAYQYHASQALRYDRLTRYVYAKLYKAIKELHATLPVERMIFYFNIDGHEVTVNNERQAEKLTQSYPTANVRICDWLTGELLDEAPADAIFNVEPKIKQ
jgi:hypothetical protein